MATAMILLPRTAIRAGDVIMLKAMISHPMETGYRRTEIGGEIPRNIIRQFSCRYDGELIFSCEFHRPLRPTPFCHSRSRRCGQVCWSWSGVAITGSSIARKRAAGRFGVRAATLGLVLLAALTGPGRAEDIPAGQRLSGFEMMGPEAQAMQRDDFANPAMLAVKDGERLWSLAPPSGKPACAGCHADATPIHDRGGRALSGARSCYQYGGGSAGPDPALPEPPSGRNAGNPGIRHAAGRWRPLSPCPRAACRCNHRANAASPRLWRAGRRSITSALASSISPARNAIARIGAAPWVAPRIPQGHPTGYPIFRMEWQAMGSLQRRLRNCLTGVRAEPFRPGAPEWIDLEAYLKQRAAGMASDAPGVRP